MPSMIILARNPWLERLKILKENPQLPFSSKAIIITIHDGLNEKRSPKSWVFKHLVPS